MGPGADFRHGWMGPGANLRCGHMESGIDSLRAQGCRHKPRIHARAEIELGAALAIETRVWVRTGMTSSAGLNEHVLERGRAHAATEGAHAAIEAGV